eukprot:228221_1
MVSVSVYFAIIAYFVNGHDETCNSSDCEYYELPTIDINMYRNGNEETRANIGQLFDTAFHNVGVVKLINYNISSAAINKIYIAGRNFFDLPQDTKLQYRLRNTAKCGYTPMDALKVTGSDYTKEGEARKQNDYDFTEIYFLQFKQLLYGNITFDVAADGNDSMLYPNLMVSANDYVMNLKLLRKTVHEIAGLGLGLKDINYFENTLMSNFEMYFPFILFLYYPSIDFNSTDKKLNFRLREHTDAMTFTFVKNDNINGLQIYIDEKWYNIEPSSDGDEILLFAGDAMKVYTNNWWKSTRHRVAFTSNEARMTISYFVGPDYDKMIQPLDCGNCKTDQTEYEPRSVSEHFRKKFDGDIET